MNLSSISIRAILSRYWRVVTSDPDGMRRAATISIWARWFLTVGVLIEVSYRVELGSVSHVLNSLYALTIVVPNAIVHRQLRSGRGVDHLWLLALSALDVTVISFSVSISGGIESRYFVLYYPVVAIFASVFTAPYINLLWTSMVVVLYAGLCVLTWQGLDLTTHEDKILYYRILGMYGVAVLVNLITRLERRDREAAVAREAELSRQRIALSQSIHDTTAQSAYMINLGLETALIKLDDEELDLKKGLQSTRELSTASMWNLRLPIDGGNIFRGSKLGPVLEHHAETFEAITGIPIAVLVEGEEPEIAPVNRSMLLTIAHNALTNAYRHAGAEQVGISIEFGEHELTLTIYDDGVGLPEDYMSRGNGFRNMTEDAARLDGRLEIETGSEGTAITCIAPYAQGVTGK